MRKHRQWLNAGPANWYKRFFVVTQVRLEESGLS